MFIQTEATQDPETIRFLPGQAVLESGPLAFDSAEAAAGSPLAQRLFAIDQVAAITFGVDYVQVTKASDADWLQLRPQVLAAIMEHFVAGEPVLLAGSGDADAAAEADPEILAQIEELLESRIRPALEAIEGDITLKRLKGGVAELEMPAEAIGYLGPISNMMRHFIPEIVAVREYRDPAETPGLGTPQGLMVQRLLDEEINPAVASHGGYISLVDVAEDVVYIRLEGGCQGCGMADVTLKQGIEASILRQMPEIQAVRDTTDHAGGSNPYYQPSSK
jgi:Fe-S cluster biogenesis protein NfuA